jgi:hypothetical protein
MKSVSLSLAIVFASTAVMAQGRPSTTAMSCASAGALVRSSHAVVLNTGGYTYDRFVSDQSQCPKGQTTMPGFAPAADNPQCLVGWRCLDLPREER